MRRWWVINWPGVVIVLGLSALMGVSAIFIGWWAVVVGPMIGACAGVPIGLWMYDRMEAWEDAHTPPVKHWWSDGKEW